MIKLKDVAVDIAGTIGATTLLTNIVPRYEYVNGNKTDNIIAYRYEVALPERHLAKINVDIDGPQQMELPEGNVNVVFTDLVLYLGWNGLSKSYELRARATGIGLTPARSNK